MTWFRLLSAIAVLAVPAFAEDGYALKLTRPVKAGQKSKLEARLAVQSTISTQVDKDLPEDEDVNLACKISGELTVVQVNNKGVPSSIRFVVSEAESTSEGEAAELFQPGDVVTVVQGADEELVLVNGADPDESQSELLELLFNVSGDGEGTDDDFFGRKEKVKVGDEWEGHAEQLARDMAKQNIKGLKPADFKTKARLKETTTLAGQPALRVTCEMNVTNPAAQLPSFFPTQSPVDVQIDVQTETDLPVDEKSHAIRLKAMYRFEAKTQTKTRDEEGREINVSLQFKRRAAIEGTETPAE